MSADQQETDLFGEVPKYYGNGYAAAPGTGPASKKCRDCDHMFRQGNGRKYSKCGIGEVSKGSGTDISMHSPACRLFVELKGSDAK